MKTLLFHTETHYSPSLNLGLLILRLGAGLFMAFSHGIGKIPVDPNFVGFIAKIGFPAAAAFAWTAALSELVGGILITLGLLTRLSALFLTLTMATAAFIAHGSDTFAKKELSLIYLIIYLSIFFTGAGKYSTDSLINKKR